MIQLSHTAKELYKRCPMAYYMHYILGIREKKVGSALPFGTAIDEGLNKLLEGKTLEQAIKEFNKQWANPKINGVFVDGPTTNLIKFSKSDIKEGLADTEWGCLKVKGEMLINAYAEEIMPQIKDVLAIQKPINIKNADGDLIRGFADIIVETYDQGNLLIDNKTSAKAYAKDAVEVGDKAPQLALYYDHLKNQYKLNGAGFYVLEKGIRKREPQTRIQVLTGVPTDDMIEKTFQEFDEVLTNVKMGRFPSNNPECNTFYGNCICNLYGPSDGQDMTGLVKVKRSRNANKKG